MNFCLGVIGLGNMGRRISLNLLKKFGSLFIYDNNLNAIHKTKKKGITVVGSPAEIAKKSDIIILVVPGPDEVEEVLFSKNGIFNAGREGIIIIDMTTSDPKVSKKFAKQLAQKKIVYLDSPMTGGTIGAQTGQLLLMVGGDIEAFNKCLPIFNIISKKAFYMGKVGSGHLMKLIHNQLSHATFLATCEAVCLGKKYNLPMDTMIKVFNLGNARSYSTEVRFPKYILTENYNMGATFDIVNKDISLVQKIANEANIELPINDCTSKYWGSAVKAGKGNKDCTLILSLMETINSKNL